MSKPAATNAATKPKTRSPSPLFAAVVSKFPNKKSNVKRPDPVGQHMRGISIEQTTSSSTPKQSPTSIKKNNSFETIDTADVIGGPSISSMTCGAAGAAVVSTKKNEELGNNNNGSSSTPMLDDNTVPSIKRDTTNLSLIQEVAELDHDDDGQYNHIIGPYAIRHDEIVTALIDDALQQSSHRNDGENDEGDSSSPLDISITNTATSKEEQKQQPSSSAAAANNIDNSNREDNSGGDPKKPRSPYRMKRNISQALANHSPVKIRKRSNDNDKKQQSKLKSSFTRLSSSNKPHT